ncbi:DNA polymerase ligase N-terminal domain-containing protein [Actinomadura flavalba]|uniref:DNA polymerase ligase N-terminal domain-containing protein n=1 Tax=Actinomadura flavalba TaxID=1120938 RepID=UPI0004771D08|nr:DNA polymerase ligase N-terminal domain-containing protein [Actinomadura flavalba]
MSDRLAEYRRRRSAERTPEPVPRDGPLPAGRDDTFVVQEHHATSLHWDLRLERNGVLVSWAVPKGLPPSPKTNHLAVHTEDHPLDYASFEGDIPAGEYGGGRVILWDRGTYETEKWTDREVKFVLHGTRVSGRYVLFQTGGKNWMIHRMDPPADPSAAPPPDDWAPMLPERRERLPRDASRWAFEFAYGGRRALARVEGGRTRFLGASGPSRLGTVLGEALGARPALLDGEFAEVDGRAAYLVFDVLHLDGHPLLDAPYEERRDRLDGLGLASVTPWFPGDGAAVRDAAARQGLASIVAKRLDSRYRPGATSPDWRLLPAGN